jgi:hypothetical protein
MFTDVPEECTISIFMVEDWGEGSSTLKVQAARSFEIASYTYQTIWHYIQEGSYLDYEVIKKGWVPVIAMLSGHEFETVNSEYSLSP